MGNPTTWKGSSQSFNTANQNTYGGTLSFDANGNPAGYSGAALTWDANNKLVAAGSVLTAGYGADGLRAWKQNSSGRTYFLYDGLTPVCETDGSGNVTAVNTWGANGLLARHTSAGSVFYAFDPQGSVSVRLNTSGTVLSSHCNEAWGTQVSTGSGYASDPYAGYGGQWGYYRDSETGLHLLGHRYYDVSNGRFLNRDPMGYGGGINMYAYCGNNGIAAIDPEGLQGFGMWNDWGHGGRYNGPDFSNGSWARAIGNLMDWFFNAGPEHRKYPKGSPESNEMQQCSGGEEIRNDLARAGYPPEMFGNVSTFGAFLYTITEPGNGTQAQVGGFVWWGIREGNIIHIHAYNEMNRHSFFYHLPTPDTLRSECDTMGTIYQDYYWDEPVHSGPIPEPSRNPYNMFGAGGAF